MGRIGMSQRELRRVEVLARVKSKELKVVDAASLVGVSYRQAKRLWKRYREEGAQGLRHRSAGRVSARAKPAKISPAGAEAGAREVLGRGGASASGRRWQPSTWPAKTGCGSTRRRCGDGCWRRACGAGSASGSRIGSGGSGGGTLGSWCRWTAALKTGWKDEDPTGA